MSIKSTTTSLTNHFTCKIYYSNEALCPYSGWTPNSMTLRCTLSMSIVSIWSLPYWILTTKCFNKMLYPFIKELSLKSFLLSSIMAHILLTPRKKQSNLPMNHCDLLKCPIFLWSAECNLMLLLSCPGSKWSCNMEAHIKANTFRIKFLTQVLKHKNTILKKKLIKQNTKKTQKMHSIYIIHLSIQFTSRPWMRKASRPSLHCYRYVSVPWHLRRSPS